MAAQGKGEGGKHHATAASTHQLSNAIYSNSYYLPYTKELQNHRMAELALSPHSIVLLPSISLCNTTHLSPTSPQKQPPARVLGESHQKGTKSSRDLDMAKGPFRGAE